VALEAAISLLLASILILGTALWWFDGARMALAPLRFIDLGAFRLLERLDGRLFSKGSRLLRNEHQTQQRLTFEAEAHARATFSLHMHRWVGGLGLLAFAGWLIGHSVVISSDHSKAATIGYLGLISGGIALVGASVGLWKAYPWWVRKNPFVPPTRLRGRAAIRLRRGRDGDANLVRLRFAQAPAIIGVCMVGFALYRLFFT
jgi:hypothetical protein